MLRDADITAIHNAGLISAEQRDSIAAFLDQQRSKPEQSQPRFDLTHVLWYAGALIIMGAMGLFTTKAFNDMGGWALTICGAAYAAGAISLGHYFWHVKNLRIPGGLLIAIAVSMVPMMVYGVQDALDLWKFAQGDPGEYKNFFPYIHGSWLYMEIATILAAFAAVYRYPFSFILLIAGIAGWFMSMDLAMWFTGKPNNYWDIDTRRIISIMYGMVMIALAWFLDLRRNRAVDLPFWLHIFGAMTFWGGLSWSNGGTQLEKLIYCLICVALIGFSLFLNRRIYAVFGTLGVAGYLGYLAGDVFQDAIMFSFALSAIGLAVIFLGLSVNRNREKLTTAFDAVLPDIVKQIRPN
jgi:hypothetical protein